MGNRSHHKSARVRETRSASQDLRIALNRIGEQFSNGSGNGLQDGDWLEMLVPVAAASDATLRQLPIEVHKFLYYGACHFDRWIAPTPVVVESTDADHYRNFVGTLRRYAPEDDNVLIFALHDLRSELYDGWAISSTDVCPPRPNAKPLAALADNATRIREPSQVAARQQFHAARTHLIALCEALGSHQVFTHLTVELPHAVVRAPFVGDGTWRGLHFTYSLTPDASQSDGWTATGTALVTPVGLTRANSGTCQVHITVRGLVEHNAWSPYASAYAAEGAPPRSSSGQPFCQTLLFLLLADLVAGLQDSRSEYVDPLWTVVPRDISRMSVRIIADDVEIQSVPHIGMGMMQVTTGPLEERRVDFRDLKQGPYWAACSRQAQGLLTLGGTREALLWLNMAVEALLDERITALTEDDAELREKLTGSKLLFAEAEAVVAEQFPELAGKVVWPERQQTPSRFAQIKGLCDGLPLGATSRTALSKYSRIARKRNDVIHGRDIGSISAADIEAGLVALSWLDDNLRLNSE
jgi:hypothetical protein